MLLSTAGVRSKRYPTLEGLKYAFQKLNAKILVAVRHINLAL